METHPAADLFPLLGEDELEELAEDIRTHGLLEPVWTCQGRLLDGRNRVLACERVGVAVTTREYGGDDPIGFALSLNLKRRHLTTGQKAMLALKVEPLYAAEAAERRATTQGRPKKLEADLPQVSPQPGPVKQRREPQARDRAASTAGTSGRAVAQAKRVAEKAPDLVEKVESGTLALDRAERIVRDRDAAERRMAEAAQQVAQLEVGTTVEIRHGDFREVLADLENVGAIITDPPYSAEFLPLLADLGAWADKVLAPDGVLAVLMGQTYLPEVYRLLDGHRPYRWTACYLTPGAGYASHPRKVQSNWKPLLVYGAGRSFGDVFRADGRDADAKDRHEWGQDYGAFHDIVGRLTKPGQTVVDPFMGSGTTLLAARTQGRHAIGCDVDLEHVATARRWLS